MFYTRLFAKFALDRMHHEYTVPVLIFLGTPPLVLIVVKLRARVSLPAQTGRLLARLRLVVGQDVRRVQPFGVVVQETPFFVEAVLTSQVVGLAVLYGLQLPGG